MEIMAAVRKSLNAEQLSSLIPLNMLDQSRLQELIDKAEVVEFRKGQPITPRIAKNQIAYLLSGSVERAPNSPQAETIQGNTRAALLPILEPNRRQRTIAKSHASLLCIDSELLEMLQSLDTASGFEVDELETSDAADWVSGLLQSQAILSLTPANIQALISAVQPFEVKADEAIFSAGDEADFYYIISRGECVVEKDGETLAQLSTGDGFGEEALIMDTCRNANVHSVTDCMLLRLSKEDFKEILQGNLITDIDQEKADTLLEQGARLLALDPTTTSQRPDQLQIALPELRSKLPTLDRQTPYIVSANKDAHAAAGTFILSQHRFKAYWIKGQPEAEEEETSAEQAPQTPTAAESESGAAHRARIQQLSEELETARHDIARHRRSNDEFASRIRQLEGELHQTEAEAKQAILESSTLKNRNESKLRQRIQELDQQLQSSVEEKQQQAEQKQALQEELTSLKQELQSNQGAAALQESQSAAKQAELSVTIDQLQQELLEQQQRGEHQIADNEQLRQHLAQLEEEKEHLKHVAEQQQNELDAQSQQLDGAHTRLHSDAEQVNAMGQELDTLKQQLAEQAQTLAEQTQQNTSLTQNIGELQQQLKEQQLLRDQLQLELQDQQADNKLLNDTLTETQQSLKQAQEEASELHERIETLKQDLSIHIHDSQEHLKALEQDHQHELDQKQTEIEELQTEITETKQRSEALDTELGELQTTHQALNDEHEQLKELHTTLQNQSEEQAEQLTQQATRIDDLEQRVKDGNQQIADLHDQTSSLEKELRTAVSYKEHAESEQKCAEENTDYLSNQIDEIKRAGQARQEELQQEIEELKAKLQVELDKPVLIDGEDRAELDKQIDEQRARNEAAEIANSVLEGRLTKLATDLAEANERVERAEAIAQHAEEELAVAHAKQRMHEDERNEARQAAAHTADQLDEATKLAALRKNFKAEEKARRKEERKGKHRALKLLMLLAIVAGGGYGVAQYLGIDLMAGNGAVMMQLNSIWNALQPYLEKVQNILP